MITRFIAIELVNYVNPKINYYNDYNESYSKLKFNFDNNLSKNHLIIDIINKKIYTLNGEESDITQVLLPLKKHNLGIYNLINNRSDYVIERIGFIPEKPIVNKNKKSFEKNDNEI